jgi:hypothetical protein
VLRHAALLGVSVMEKRTVRGEIDQLDLFGARPDVTAQGVGARQTHQDGATRGGGYLKICGSQNFESSDPRLDELRAIGLPNVWMAVAERVGFDAWMDVWRMLEAEEAWHEGEGTLRMRLRRYTTYQRYQRNRYIEALARQGITPAAARKLLAENLGEFLTEKHVGKLMRQALGSRE